MYAWKPFLDQLSEAILASDDLQQFGVPERVRRSGWLGYPGAAEDQITAVEAELGMRLPPSYREFLLVSNGFRTAGPLTGALLRVEDIDWLRNLDPDFVNQWVTGMGAYIEDLEERDLPHTLAVSVNEADMQLILLNPEVQNADGEWEAWSFAHWHPGALIYPSFWDLMQTMIESQQDVNEYDYRRANPDVFDAALGARLPDFIAQLEQMIAPDGAPSNPLEIGSAGFKAGIIEAVERIRTFSTDDSMGLRKALRELANELYEASQQQESLAKGLITSFFTNPAKMLSGMDEMMKYQAYMRIAVMIRHFLRE